MKVELVFWVIKRRFGLANHGLERNTNQLFVSCALANLFMQGHCIVKHRGAWFSAARDAAEDESVSRPETLSSPAARVTAATGEDAVLPLHASPLRPRRSTG